MAGANELTAELPALGYVCADFEAGDLVYFKYWDRHHGTIERRWGIILGCNKEHLEWDYEHLFLAPKFRVLWLNQTVGIHTIIDTPWVSDFDYDSLQGKWSQIVARPSVSDRINLRKTYNGSVQNEF